jgi:hypothetical protein
MRLWAGTRIGRRTWIGGRIMPADAGTIWGLIALLFLAGSLQWL